ncbi:hypothetical protein [Sphingobacterium sp.]|uniref:hypothetical protein n=1 Tax=Sphingobacterium sp. TaxID=341027 RepID=UPI0031D91BAF
MSTKAEIFNKIGDLLQDLNAQYLVLSEKSGSAEIAELVRLEAKAQSVAAYITLLKTDAVLEDKQTQNTLRDSVIDSKKIAFNDYFTPPSSLRTSSPIIIEREPLEKEVARNDEPIKDEPVQAEEEHIAAANVESEERDNLPTTPYSSTSVSESKPVTHENAVEHIKENHYKIDDPKIDLIDEPPVVVTAVVEEPKEIIIEEAQQSFIQEEINTVVEETPSRPLTLNEIISQQKQAGVQNRVYQVNQSGSSDKLTDIKTGISLNDKLLFIKDLFNGYSLAYSEAVELLNRFSTYAEADAFLQTNYAVKNRWADKPHTVEKLYEVLRRRYN